MEQEPTDTFWHIVEYLGWIIGAIASAVIGFGWKEYMRDRSRLIALETKQSSADERADTMASAIEDAIERQNHMEHELGDQRVTLAEVRNDVRWIRDVMERELRNG